MPSTQTITSQGGITYDVLGNVINDGFHSYTYDAENRMTLVDGGSTATYVYDAFGRRVKTPNYDAIYDLDNHAVALLDPNNGGWAFGEIYAGGRHLATYSDGTTNFVHTDWLGTKRAMTSVTGGVSETCTSLPFGDGNNCTGTNWGYNNFTDDTHDFESNLEHTQFRQLSTTQGRWLSPDPAGMAAVDLTNPQSLNRYAYVLNASTRFTDPKGLRIVDCSWEFCGPPCSGCGGGGGGGAIVDGLPQTIFNTSGLGSNGQEACPNNVCDGFTKSGGYFQFVAGAGGASGYIKFSDIVQGMYEANGTFMSNSQYHDYILSSFGNPVEAQRVALAQRIAGNSNGTISYQQAYNSLDKNSGYLQGGNYDFGETTYGPGNLGCGADASRCNGIHFPAAGFVHLDTSNPLTGVGALFQHLAVDVILGNIYYTVIPRH